jgi:hypothetical protein
MQRPTSFPEIMTPKHAVAKRQGYRCLMVSTLRNTDRLWSVAVLGGKASSDVAQKPDETTSYWGVRYCCRRT